MTIIGLKELRQHATEIAQRAQQGESFTVVKRSKPMFKVVPLHAPTPGSAELQTWTENAIEQYRPALEALAKQWIREHPQKNAGPKPKAQRTPA